MNTSRSTLTTFRTTTILAALILSGWSAHAQAPAEPAPEHLALQKLAGEWMTTTKDGTGTETKGTMTATVECGGMWLLTNFRSEMWGSPYQGRGTDGFDPATGKYVSVWVDSMSTRPLVFEGTMDKEKKTKTLTAKSVGMNGEPITLRSVTHYPHADRQEFTLYVVSAGGTEDKLLSIDYTRKK